MHQAIAELFEPERDDLRLPAKKLAALFLSLLFSRSRAPDHAVDTEELVDVFLHGATR